MDLHLVAPTKTETNEANAELERLADQLVELARNTGANRSGRKTL
jgi:hypothetical protein